MKFDIKELPYAQFEHLGMNKRDVITMPAQDLATLLNGGRTGLLPLTITLGQGMQPIQAQAKLSLMRNPDNTLSLGVHPILSKPANTIDATPEQWAQLLKGEPIVKDSKAYNGSVEPHIHQLDKDTNEILTARIGAIQIPSTIKDVVLTPAQKEHLKKGMPLEIEGKGGKEYVVIRLDLNEQKGFKVVTGEQARQLMQEMKQGIENVSRGIKM